MAARGRTAAVFLSVIFGGAFAAAAAHASQQASPTIADGVFSEDQADAGADLYQRICERCHGSALRGTDMVPALTGPKFAMDWNGASLGDLYDRIRIAMPADMPATLERGEALIAVAFILRANGAPPGKAELPNAPAVLRGIRITGLK